jgi:hypothetical protein
MKTMAEIGDVVEEADRWIVQAAIDGANEQLVPYDPEFAAVFEDVVADNPLLVENGDNDYYLVPFAESYNAPVEEVDAMIADLEAMKNAVPAAHEAAIQASIDELASLRNDLNLDRGEILVVIIIDADDGHFKEASWVTEPVVYLPTTSVYYVNQQGELFDADADCDGYLISEGDCDDNNAAVNPGAICGECYGESVLSSSDYVFYPTDALHEPDGATARLYYDERSLSVELECTISDCTNVSIWAVWGGLPQPPWPLSFDLYVSPNGADWTKIGSDTVGPWDSLRQYDYSGNFGDVRYIRMDTRHEPGPTDGPPRFIALDAVYAAK